MSNLPPPPPPLPIRTIPPTPHIPSKDLKVLSLDGNVEDENTSKRNLEKSDKKVKPDFLKINNADVLFKLTKCLEENNVGLLSQLLTSGEIYVNSYLPYGVPIILKATRSKSSSVIDFLLAKGADPASSIEYLLEIMDMRTSTNRFSYFHDSFLNAGWCDDYVLKMFSFLNDDQLREFSKRSYILLQTVHLPKLLVFEYLLLQRHCKLHGNDFHIICALLERSDEPIDNSFRMLKWVLLHPYSSLDIHGMDGFQLLCKALLMNMIDFFCLLIKKGANPYLQTEEGNTLMHFPEKEVSYNRFDLPKPSIVDTKRIVLLHDIGLNTNATNKIGEKPLDNIDHTKWELLILIILGRSISNADVEKLDVGYGNGFSFHLKRFNIGYFPSLKHLCRRKIRNSLYLKSIYDIKENIYCLPLPNPLKQYLDVISYAEKIIKAFK